MIEKLVVKNFQCHESLEVDLSNPITCIVGASDKGKSAILRALRWAATNKPSGSAFLRNGAEEVSSTIYLDDRTIQRKRKGNENTYYLDGSEYKAFGTNVPDDITNLINISDVNFAGQLDSPWYFLLSPGEVSKELNAIVNLDLIDRTTSNLAAANRQAVERVKLADERLSKARLRKANLGWVKQANKQYLEIESLENQKDGIDKDIKKLSSYLQEINKLKTILQSAEDKIIKLEEIVELDEQAIKIKREITVLAKTLEEITTWKSKVKKNNAEIMMIEKKIEEKSKGKCPVCGGVLKTL